MILIIGIAIVFVILFALALGKSSASADERYEELWEAYKKKHEA